MGKLQAADYLDQFHNYQPFQTQDAHIPEWWEMHPDLAHEQAPMHNNVANAVSNNPDSMRYELTMKGK